MNGLEDKLAASQNDQDPIAALAKRFLDKADDLSPEDKAYLLALAGVPKVVQYQNVLARIKTYGG